MQIIQTEEEMRAFYQKCLLTLKECFPVTPPPTLEQLGFDEIPVCLGEEEEIALYFAGKRWDELSLTIIWNDYVGDPSAILTFLNNVGFVYYIPAFVLMFLKHKEKEVDIVGDAILGEIRGRSNVLSRKQRQAILPILLYVASAPEFEPYEYFLNPPEDRLQDCIKLCSS